MNRSCFKILKHVHLRGVHKVTSEVLRPVLKLVFLSFFLCLALVLKAGNAYAYSYTQVWQDHFTTDPLGATSDCGTSSGGPGPTGWKWVQNGGCIQQTGSVVNVYNDSPITNGPDIYRQDLNGIAPTNYRIDWLVNFYDALAFGQGVVVTCQPAFGGDCGTLKVLAFMGMVYDGDHKFDVTVVDNNLAGGQWYYLIASGSAVLPYENRWHRLRLEKYGTTTYLYVDLFADGSWDITHTSTNTAYRATTAYIGDPTTQAGAGWWTRVSADHVTIYQVNANDPPSNGSVSPASGCSGPGTTVRFTTTHSDPQGYNDIQYVHLLLNSNVDGNNSAFYGYYNLNNNHFYLYDSDRNKNWMDAGVDAEWDVSSLYATLKASSTHSTSGNTLTVYWDIEFKPGWTENVNSYLYTIDDSGAVANWEDKGDYSIDGSGPNTPTHASPADNYCTNNATPTLTSNVTSDVGCGGGVQYYIRVWNSAGAIVANSDWMGGTSYTTPALATGTYTWQILARDRFGNNSAWSGARTIMIDTSAPLTPPLNSPADGSKTVDTTPTLTVNAVSDVGCNGAVLYQIVVDNDSNFGSLNADSGWQSATSYTASPALTPGTYYWRARVKDGFGNTSGWSASWSFTVVGTGSIVGRVWNSTGDDTFYSCTYNPGNQRYTGSAIRVGYDCETWDPNYDPVAGTCWTTTSTAAGQEGTYRFNNVPESGGVGHSYSVSITVPLNWWQTTRPCNTVFVPVNGEAAANFGISSNPPAWIQGVNGDIYGNEITVRVVKDPPGAASGYARWFLAANPATSGGVVISGNNTLSCGGNGDPGRCCQRPGGDTTVPGWIVRNEGMGWPPLTPGGLSADPFPGGGWLNLGPNKVYRFTSNLTISSLTTYDLTGDGVAIIHVQNANLTFNANFVSSSEYRKGVIFIVENGQVTVNGAVSQIHALILVINGSITVEGSGAALTVRGMLYAQNGINFSRTLSNNRIPAVQVRYNPLYFHRTNPLAVPQITWREIAP